MSKCIPGSEVVSAGSHPELLAVPLGHHRAAVGQVDLINFIFTADRCFLILKYIEF